MCYKDMTYGELITKAADIFETTLKDIDENEGDFKKQFEICKKVAAEATEVFDQISKIYRSKFPEKELLPIKISENKKTDSDNSLNII